MEVHVDRNSNSIVRVTGREGVPPNDGMLCVKGRFGYDFIASPARLKKPLVKRKGKLVPVSWDYALDYTSERLAQILREYGPDTISGLACARDTNENNYAMMKFMRAVVGTNNIDHCART
jgi:predicted molibdopterin-dependent oxidoreductase YjgC